MASYDALDIANYFVEQASCEDESDLTNLKLQKLLYLAQCEYLTKYEKPLFDDPIEAWPLGPVIQHVYDTFKECGGYPISCFDVDYDAQTISNEMVEFLDYVWAKWSIYSAAHLVDLTHEEGSPWSKAYDQGTKTEISLEMLDSFGKKK